MRYLRNRTDELSGAVAASWGLRAFERQLISGALIALFWLLVMPNPLQAAPIPLVGVPGSPNIVTSQSKIKYDWNGSGGTLTISGILGEFGYNPAGHGSVLQSFVMPSSWGLSTSAVVVRGANAGASAMSLLTHYYLEASFNSNGQFVTGTVTVDGAVDADKDTAGMQYAPRLDPTIQFFSPSLNPNPCYLVCSQGGLTGGSLLHAELVNFGFVGDPVGGGHDDINFQWQMLVDGGDLLTAGYDSPLPRFDVGIIAAGLVSYGTLDPNTLGQFGAAWDPNAINDTTAFKSDFVSCSNCTLLVDTFVPVPAAIWLFGSGLMGLLGLGARNRARNRLAA